MDQAVSEIRVSIDDIVDDVVEYASWDGDDINIIDQVSLITDALEKAMTNIPVLDDLFDPNVISPIKDTLSAMMVFASQDPPCGGCTQGVIDATGNLINQLDSLLAAADDCANEAADIESYIQNYIDTALVFTDGSSIEELVGKVVDLAAVAADYVDTTGRESVLAVYDSSTSGWFNLRVMP